MILVEPGYNRPEIPGPVSANAERLIESSCPGISVHPWDASAATHPFWGPCLDIAVGYAENEEIRFRGSSGGVLSALAIHALELGAVDGVLVVTGDTVHPTRNRVQVARSRQEILESAGSRYSPSSPLEQVNQLLDSADRILFIGKPCDVSALRLLGREDPRVNAVFPIVLSFFCAGIPSVGGASKILGTMCVEESELTSFRYRGCGWPGHATATLRNGSVVKMSYEESWGDHLSSEVQFRCKVCPDAVGGVADLVCADAWYGGEGGYPTFEELPGRSLIIPRTETGLRLMEDAVKDGWIRLNGHLSADEIDLMQPSQARRKRLVRARIAALACAGRRRPKMDNVFVDEAAGRASLLERARAFAGTLRRVILKRRSWFGTG